MNRKGKRAKKKNVAGAVCGLIALLGMFLPYVRGQSFFQTLSSSGYGFLAPYLTLCIALAMVLFALGFWLTPFVIGLVSLMICGAFPICACFTLGAIPVLSQFQAGFWVLLGGLLLMAASQFFYMEKEDKEDFTLDNSHYQ